MSQTPMESSSAAEKKKEGSFSANHRRLFQLMEEGKSWSGHERNCAFLNTGGGRFANISAVSGFDYLDDARGLALVDWDHDGDLDLWITNRTAPRVRVMRNDTPSDHHFLALRLQGTTSNRDAIGARAVLTIEGAEGPRKLTKTVRAGEGYLAQSSKWLHFGLGDASRPVQLTVRWPDGQVEQFTDLDVDTRYGIVQGTGTASVRAPRSQKVQLVSSQPTMPAVTLQAAVLLPMPVPLPPLEYTSFDGEPAIFTGNRDKPMLVNLWASWCLPCARELAEFTSRAEELRAAGLDVIALSVDGLGSNQSTTPEDARQLLAKLNFPFSSGVATIGLLDKLQIVHNQLFAMHRPLPVPTSLLIDTEGHLAAIYKGPVAVERLLADVALLSQGSAAWRTAALPFDGLWKHFPESSLLPLVGKFVEAGYVDEAVQYTLENKSLLATDPMFASLLISVGRELAKRGELDAAIVQFKEALSDGAEDFTFADNVGDFDAHRNLGLALQSQGKVDEAIVQFGRAAELKPDAGVFNSLGRLLASQQRLEEAIEAFGQAVELDPDLAEAHYSLGMAFASLRKLDEAIGHMSRAAQLNPDDASVRTNLGKALHSVGRFSEAADHLRRALELQPDLVAARDNMAILLMSQGRTEDAIEHWRGVIQTDPDQLSARLRLADALQKQGQLDEAIEQMRQASSLAPNDANVPNSLGQILARSERWSAAVEAFTEALRLQPDSAGAHVGLANVLARVGNHQEAVEHFLSALEQEPGRFNAARRVAWILAVSDDIRARDGAEAVRWAEHAVSLTGGKEAADLDILAAAYAESGRWAEAITTAEQAIALAAEANQSGLSDQIAARLLLYQQQQPYRARLAR